MSFKPGDRIIIKDSTQIVLRRISEVQDGFIIDEHNRKFEVEKVRAYKPYFDDIRIAEQKIKESKLALLEELYTGKLKFHHQESPVVYIIVGQTDKYLWYMAEGRDHMPPESYGKSTFRDRLLSGFVKPIEPKEGT